MKTNELTNFGFDPALIKAWKESGVQETLPIQDLALNEGANRGESLLVIAPTSSGKTFLGEMIAMNYALKGMKSLYLVPFKAIAEERFDEFTHRYSNKDISLKCIISDKDRREHDRDLMVGKYDIGILTYEKLSTLLVSNRAMLDVCSCVIIDEVQMIMDTGRGPGLELLLTKLKIIGKKCQIICLSAVLGDLNGFDDWLKVKSIRHRTRPVELRTGIVELSGEYSYKEWNGGTLKKEQFQKGDTSGVVKELLQNNEQVLIIKNSVKGVEDTAALYASFLNLNAAAKTLDQLRDEPDTETKEKLTKNLRHGVGFHHGDCELSERLATEAGFRSGEIKVLVATTTLSMGVNLPCDNVILADHNKWEQIRGAWQQTPWTLSEVNNILGRAGRFGKTAKFGRGIFFAHDNNISRQLKHRYFNSSLSPVKSSLSETDIDKRVLDVLATGFAHTQQELETFLFSTFAGLSWTNSEARQQISRHITTGVQKCVRYELAEINEDATIKVTKLGRICAAKQCSLDSFQKLKEFVVDTTTFDYLDVAFAAARTAEVREGIRRIKWDDSERSLTVRNRLNALFVDNKLVGLIQKVFSALVETKASHADPEFIIASVCRDVLETNLLSHDICASYRITGSQIRQMAENVAWMADAMSGIAETLRPDLAFKFQEVVRCIQLRAPYNCRLLNDLPAIVSRDERVRLFAGGIKTTEDFITRVPNEFKGIMSPTKADRIIQSLLATRTRNFEFWERDHNRRLDILGFRTEEISKLYSAKGKDLEIAIKTIFDSGFSDCAANLIHDQESGEPDILLVFKTGKKACIQVTAKEDNRHYIDSKKAGDVIPQSAKFQPDVYICMGRPDFQPLAIEQALHLSKMHNFKLIPIYILAELYVRHREGVLTLIEASEILFNERGYINMARLYKER